MCAAFRNLLLLLFSCDDSRSRVVTLTEDQRKWPTWWVPKLLTIIFWREKQYHNNNNDNNEKYVLSFNLSECNIMQLSLSHAVSPQASSQPHDDASSSSPSSPSSSQTLVWTHAEFLNLLIFSSSGSLINKNSFSLFWSQKHRLQTRHQLLDVKITLFVFLDVTKWSSVSQLHSDRKYLVSL